VRAHFLLASIKLRSTAAAGDEFLSATQPLALFQPQYNIWRLIKNFTLLFIFLTVRDENVFFEKMFFYISHIFFGKQRIA
jgi:hypothetical protein